MNDDVVLRAARPPHAMPGAPQRVSLAFARDPSGRTFIAQQYAGYPYHICRPFHYADDPAGMATVYLQSCSGGIFQGDCLKASILVQAGAAAHITSQASTIVHSMERGGASQVAAIEAEAQTFVEYLPDPLILFPNARVETELSVCAHETATVIVGDAFLTHDPAGGAGAFESLTSTLAIWNSAGQRLALDRFVVRGDEFRQARTGVNGPYRAHGTLVALQRRRPVAAVVESLRRAVMDLPGVYAGVSAFAEGAGAWVRLLAEDGAALRLGMERSWVALRETLAGNAPRLRRK